MTVAAPTLAALTQQQLAALTPELLLSGHLIDRSGMAHLISAFGREAMADVAIEEWAAASPVYTQRMRVALGIDGDGVEEMFKCLQFDIGAPPQFMDFRYTIDDKYHGSFLLAHCGALLDVEPMGDDYVMSMCHDIEDPTFDATAIATNRRARIRPIHRPPRRPADRVPHCEWTVTIEPNREPLPLPADAVELERSRAGVIELSPIDATAEDGLVDYRGPLMADLQFHEWSRLALVRLAEEIALQQQLLALGFGLGLRRRTDDRELIGAICRKQLTGIAGLTAERIKNALCLGSGPEALATVLSLSPALGPVQYTGVTVAAGVDDVVVRVPRTSDAMVDGGWISLLEPGHVEPLQAIATAVDAHWVVASAEETADVVEVRLISGTDALRESGEVALTRISGGATFAFVDRGPSIPIMPV